MFAACGAAALTACATVEKAPERVSTPAVSAQASLPVRTVSKPTLKRRIAVVRFSNSTRYGKGLLYDGENDPLADQARDMLVKRLVETEGFLVFERDNLGGLAFEKSLLEDGASEFVGVDAVIVGSVTEFGRKTEGQVGFLSSTKKQTVEAAVEARLVDPKSALAFFSASGKGEASTESGEVAGFGSRAAYDASLNDSAISAAVSNMVSEIVGNLEDRPWSTDVLKVDGDRVFISGGGRQGLKVGDHFTVETLGEVIKSGQSGLPITLPGRSIAEIEVVSFFGDTEYSEGSVAQVVSGSLEGESERLIVREVK
ncbi:MAG: curli production assembly protein CsgG [Hyphomonas sp.]|nr:curli production assembly protein CsgG [Hyphomonas sp.]MAN89590.1 curli production assembly protein CsgG [Hyphomonadaceae bacterium]HCN92558.1 curli production assembly protein CsgG [Hyphomonas sp.]